uniref:hypothetical protein n=1 Tax=Sphaerothrix gracilis TaxID=3151835 RepID=UPI0031FC0F93
MKLGFLLPLLSLVCSTPVASAAKTSPSALELLPADTAMTLILDTTEETWGQLSQFQLFTLIEEYTGTVPNPGGLPYVPFDISYQSSIAPWIGES